MANYIGLQGIFNALAGAGANAVNVYAQEKEHQRRLAFEQRKFDADQAYRQQTVDLDTRRLDQVDRSFEADQQHRENQLGLDQQRINHEGRRIDLLDKGHELALDQHQLAKETQSFNENKWQHLQDTERRKQVVDTQYRLAGNMRALAMEKGYDTPRDMASAGEPDAMTYYNASLTNVARFTLNRDVSAQLVPAGTDEAGDDLFSISYSDGSENHLFGQPATLDQIATKVSAFNIEMGVPVYADQHGMAIDHDQNGKAMLVNKEGKPELSPEQKQKAQELDQQLQENTGRTLQETLDSPVLPELQAELERGQRTPKSRLTASGYPDMTETGPAINSRRAMEEDVRQGLALRDMQSRPTVKPKDTGRFTQKDTHEVITPVTDKSELPVTPVATSAPETQSGPAKTPQAQIASPRTSPRRSAAIFANQAMAAGGKDALSDARMQIIYQELLRGNPEAKASASASMTADSKKDVDTYAKFHETIRKQIDPHIENHARLTLDGQEGVEGYEQRVKLYESGIRDTLYSVSTQLKNIGYDVGKLSRHPESYRDMVAVVAKYYDAKRKAIQFNENLGWFDDKRALPNMTNFMLKTITKTAPRTAERMALSMAFEQNPDGDSGTIAKKAQTLMRQWSALETFMDDPTE